MAKPTTTPRETTLEIREEQWIPFFAEFTRENRGAHARLEVIGIDDVGYEVETENRPFDGVAADIKGGEQAVWIVFGSIPQDHLTHGIQKPTVVRMMPPTGQ